MWAKRLGYNPCCCLAVLAFRVPNITKKSHLNRGSEETYRPRVYTYNKLLATSTIFDPAEEERPVRALHLSHDHDPRNLEGRLGIERRNRLMQIRTRLQVAVTALAEADAIASAPVKDVLAELQENMARTQNAEEQEAVELAEELTN